MNKNVLIPVGLVAALFIVGGIVVLQRNAAGPAPAPPVSQTQPPGAVTPAESGPLTVSMTEWRYDPKVIRVKGGQTVKLTIKNTGKVDHAFVINDLGVDTGRVKPGETRNVEFTVPDKTAIYEYMSSVPGQKTLGLAGSLSVAATSGSGASAPVTPLAVIGFDSEGYPINSDNKRNLGPDGKLPAPLKIDSQGRLPGPDGKSSMQLIKGANGLWQFPPQPAK